jgi:SpoU rRNA methylase family enzyme
MAFVRLHRGGEPIFINSDRIAYFEAVESAAQDGTPRKESKLCFDNEMSVVVDEPLDQLRHRFL